MGVCALVVTSEESGAQRLELDNEDEKIVVGFTWMNRLQRLARGAASGLVRGGRKRTMSRSSAGLPCLELGREGPFEGRLRILRNSPLEGYALLSFSQASKAARRLVLRR